MIERRCCSVWKARNAQELREEDPQGAAIGPVVGEVTYSGSVSDTRHYRGNPRLGPIEFDVGTWVYVTVTLMSILVVYDGWQDLKRPLGIAAVVIGPTIALGTAHAFAEILESQVKTGRSTTAKEVRAALGEFAQFVLVAVPPLVLLVVTSLVFHQSPAESIRSMLVLGVASLAFWGAMAGSRVGLTGWRLWVSASVGLLIGLLVLLLQLILKPH